MKERFEVSTKGMRELQSGREPWQLAKELISNVWDETAKICEVHLTNITPRRAKFTVTDDGGGFINLNDAWTLMGHTDKRADPNKRGRFNIGEKEILSVAIDATIKTSGKIIRFPKSGGRIVRNSDNNAHGTTVECTVPWGSRQVINTIQKLKELLPPKNIHYTINDKPVPYRKPDKVVEATLDTVLQIGGIGEPMRNTRRKTSIEIYRNPDGMLYEMGIPVQPIDSPYLVNVGQKIPMPPNRDVVRDSYLQDIYRIILNEMTDDITGDNASETWVRRAVEDKEITPDTVRAIINKRYGDKVVLWSNNQLSNERAMQAGYDIIHGKTLSTEERGAMQSVGLQHSSGRFAVSYADWKPVPKDEWTEGMIAVAGYAKRLAKRLINADINVSFYNMSFKVTNTAADWIQGHLSFNIGVLGKRWFEQTGSDQTGLILHELAHYKGNGHNWEYQSSLRDLAGKAVHLALDEPRIFSK